MARVRIGVQAREDARRILDDLRRESPTAAERASQGFEDARVLVEQFPKAGPLTYQVGDQEYRSVVAGSYRVWYLVNAEDNVAILGIWHVRQRPPDLLDLETRGEQSEA